MSNLYLEGNTINVPKWIEKLVAIVLIVSFVLFIVWYFGIPFDNHRIMKNADRYIEENYPELQDKVVYKDYNVHFSPALHNPDMAWWDGVWSVYYSSEDDEFLHFSLNFNRKGELIYDGYKESYMKGHTIYNYYSGTYSGYFSKIFTDIYEKDYLLLGFNPATALKHTRGNAFFEPEAYIDNSDEIPVLDITKEYTMEELANEYGTLQFWYGSDEPTKENLIQRCIEAREIISKYNIPCNKVRIGIDFSCFMAAIPAEEFMDSSAEELVGNNICNAYE